MTNRCFCLTFLEKYKYIQKLFLNPIQLLGGYPLSIQKDVYQIKNIKNSRSNFIQLIFKYYQLIILTIVPLIIIKISIVKLKEFDKCKQYFFKYSS